MYEIGTITHDTAGIITLDVWHNSFVAGSDRYYCWLKRGNFSDQNKINGQVKKSDLWKYPADLWSSQSITEHKIILR